MWCTISKNYYYWRAAAVLVYEKEAAKVKIGIERVTNPAKMKMKTVHVPENAHFK